MSGVTVGDGNRRAGRAREARETEAGVEGGSLRYWRAAGTDGSDPGHPVIFCTRP